MTSCFNYFFAALYLFYIAAFSTAIYNPRLTTTKPPERRELVLPWHSTEKISRVHQTTSPSPIWHQLRDNITSKSGTKNWSPWRKTSGSEIEQRTQIDIPEQISKKVPEQQQSDKNYGYFKNESKYGNRPQNEIDFEHKSLKNDENKKIQVEFENEDLYEGVDIDSTKPRKGNLLLSRKSQDKIARYNPRLGVECPDNNSTGQFVYPPDCKFFVNCWKGRAFIQPCAPGTHFNPDTLECDFPHKVKCYEDESAYFKESDSVFEINRKSQKLQEPKCPPYLIGLLPHHGDCTKFVQCAHGATYIMSCGPGTVFNPTIGICDWPRNVKGCEDIFKSDKKIPLASPNFNFEYDSAKYIEAKKIICPADFIGLLPHPETCKKFLQCANGVTYVMDCGPGTVFNPITTVCDWPYNVLTCKTDKFDDKVHRMGDRTWIPLVVSTTSRSNLSPTFKPTWKPFTTSSSPLWISTWTTPRPFYDRSEHHVIYHDYDHAHKENRYQDYGPHHPEWKPSDGNLRQSFDNNYEFQDRQWIENHRIDQNPQPLYHSDRPEGSWSYEHRNQNHRYDHRYYPPGYHYHHHHHHYHNYGPTSNPSVNPNWNAGNPTTLIGDQKYDQGYQGYTPNAGDSHWYFDRNDSNHDDHHYFEHVDSNETDQRQHQSYFPSKEYNENNNQFSNVHNDKTKFSNVSDLLDSQRTDHDLHPTKQDYNWTMPGLYYPSFNHTFPSFNHTFAGNVLQNNSNNNKFTENSNQNKSRQDRLPRIWIGQENTTWNQSNGSLAFNPSTWHDQQKVQMEIQTRPWDQGMANQDDKFQQQFDKNIDQQSTIDKETNAKTTQSTLKSNVLLNSKNQINLESTNTTEHPRPNFYPNGIYVNANGIKGHYITKEIEDNQKHSKSQLHSTQKPINWNNIFNNSENDYTLFTTTLMTTTEKISNKQLELSRRGREFENTAKEKELHNFDNINDFNLSSELIEREDDYWSDNDTKTSNVNLRPPNIIESKINDYNVDVLDINVWKPRLVFENKTKTTTASSVIMKIGLKNTDIELFNIETAPFQEKEPSFPVYYVPPVHPLTYSKKSVRLTPISGQIIRLRGGSGPSNGYVEVQGVLPGWGIVCDSRNSWTLKEAHILCRQLGYSRGAEMAWQGRNNRNNMPTWIAANSVTCLGNETRFQSCKFTHNQECRIDRDAIGVRCTPNRIAHCYKDEVPHDGQCYHLADPDSGFNHDEALEYCKRRNARLIDITNQAENNFVSEWLLQSYPEVSSIMTSGFGFTSMGRTLWIWADSAHAKFKFTKWWPGWMNDTEQPPWVGSRPLCIVMKRKFSCHERPESICDTDYFFWDIEDCATTSKGHSFICKRPYDDIGCVYGKGNQYTGKANVTISGNECLSWADKRIVHQLRINVVNKEIRDRLEMHNYCRNPNPIKESRPWCFIGTGNREYCDIPACGNIDSKRSMLTGQCKPKHFECTPGECIPSPWVCDGEEDCTNGADERKCILDLNLFEKSTKHKLEGYDVEKWLNTPLKTCALRCKEADFTCRSFNHKLNGNVCLLSNSNIGLTGALKPDKEFDYYEMRERSVNCDGMYICNNRKCINQTKVCDGKNDCNDRSDENICTAENFDYGIRLAGANNSHEGRIEVKILGHWGQVCDDGFGMINADVICKELGFDLGALEVRPGGFYGNLDPPTRFMVDQLKCRGNETTLRECDFNGWGVHNCQPEEAVGIACKTAVNTCQEGYWKCDNSPTCIPTPFICDEVVDCPDHSDESSEYCNAPFELRLANGSNSLQGRVEVRHHGVWGTVCDDDFTNATAVVICRSLGYGGIAVAKKNGFFGPGQGPIWLDEVFCHGNESQLYRCEHNHWGQHNCDHNEDAGVICSPGDVNDAEQSYWINSQEHSEQNINELLPSNCGQRAKDFDSDEDLIFQKVVHGSIAPKGTYPWQASIRVRGHSRSNHWCGAVIISPLHVLTAAHCLEGYNKGTYFVRAGDYNTDINEGTEIEANIEDYYVHEEFRKGHRMNNDIALVLLKGLGIPLGKDIMPICLPAENAEYPPGLNCTISGFGSIETGKTTQSKNLRYGWVPLLDQSICRASYVYGEGAISDGMMCAGYLDEGIDTCDGDSGGPLACYYNGAFNLYGITSWGQHCGKANRPGVYVRVAYYRRWIDKKIRESLVGR
ncbi:PREDICTED: uncharacterized protein LOC108757046 isoform X3 [Trachymyrmex septentrionalis]|uniref:uncharacterized protein LOC108757046 isoform X3 n=1 Tax=Trachymyrmex septentrionalis TaxID=34720 RepID=UPI00084EEC34|nr:PREDICTED: uncharacterized protein LOC108757046 isoform X3 [Trachymyrmex septentrionalis]